MSEAADREETLPGMAGVPVKVACRPGWLNTLLAVTEPARQEGVGVCRREADGTGGWVHSAQW